jgi:hypothetical protein
MVLRLRRERTAALQRNKSSFCPPGARASRNSRRSTQAAKEDASAPCVSPSSGAGRARTCWFADLAVAAVNQQLRLVLPSDVERFPLDHAHEAVRSHASRDPGWKGSDRPQLHSRLLESQAAGRAGTSSRTRTRLPEASQADPPHIGQRSGAIRTLTPYPHLEQSSCIRGSESTEGFKSDRTLGVFP